MAIAWSTIAFLVLLLPGFAFLAGLRAEERFSRETAPINTLGQLAVVVFASFFIHGLLYGSLFSGWIPNAVIRLDYLFTALSLTEAQQVKLADVAAGLESHAWRVFFYFAGSCAVGFVFGVNAARLVASGALPGSWVAKHRWVYQLNPDPAGSKIALGYVVTDIGDAKRQLVYQGHLVDFGLGQDGRFTYLVLQSPTRRYMTFGDKGPVIGPPITLSEKEVVASTGLSMSKEGFLVIEGSNVKNFFFRPQLADLSKGAEEVARVLAQFGPPTADVAEDPAMLNPSGIALQMTGTVVTPEIPQQPNNHIVQKLEACTTIEQCEELLAYAKKHGHSEDGQTVKLIRQKMATLAG